MILYVFLTILSLGKLDMRDPGVAVVVVGDGSTPRAACLFALRTGWRAFSVDPQLKLKGPWTSLVQNVSYHRQMIEDFVLPEEFVRLVCFGLFWSVLVGLEMADIVGLCGYLVFMWVFVPLTCI